MNRAHVPVRLLAWGESEADIQKAVDHAGHEPSRSRWQFTEIERVTGTPCPINVRSPRPAVLAADAGYGWAYEVYAVR